MNNTNAIWQDLKPRERMEHLLKTGHLSDCSFVVYDNDGEKMLLKCHKFVLMSVSPVFERMFEGDFEESKIPDNIVLDDVSGNDFRKFIDYLYWHDNRRLQEYHLQTLQILIYLSKKFMISFFTNNCLKEIERRLSTLDPDVIIDLYEYSHQIEGEDLINSIRSRFCTHPGAYIAAAAVFDLSSEIFLKFIQEFKSSIGAKHRFKVIDRYCKIHGLVDASVQSSPKNTICESDEDDQDASHLSKRVKPLTLATKTDLFDGDKSEKEDDNLTGKKDENENEMEKGEEAAVEQVTKEQSDQAKNDENERQQKDEYICKLLNTIEFTSMTPYDFCAGPGISKLLTIDKKYELLSSICIAECKKHFFSSRSVTKTLP